MKKILFLLLILSLIGCNSVKYPGFKAYVKGDLSTYEVVTPDYLKWLEASELSKDEKERRMRVIESWKVRIDRTFELWEGGYEDAGEKQNEDKE